MTGITPRLPGRLVHLPPSLENVLPGKTLFKILYYYSTTYWWCVCVCIYDVTSCLSVLITASGLQGEKPLANGIK